MIVLGGGLANDGSRWISSKSNFLLPVRVLSKLFRRLMLEKLLAAHQAGELKFFGAHAHLADAKAFAAFLASLRRKRWFVYTKRPTTADIDDLLVWVTLGMIVGGRLGQVFRIEHSRSDRTEAHSSRSAAQHRASSIPPHQSCPCFRPIGTVRRLMAASTSAFAKISAERTRDRRRCGPPPSVRLT